MSASVRLARPKETGLRQMWRHPCAYELGELIKKTRLQQRLTQEQLGERIGVKKAQISRIEKGANITLPTMTRVFRALGVPTASIDFGAVGKLALW